MIKIKETKKRAVFIMLALGWLFVFGIISVFWPAPASANPPKSVEVSYDKEKQVLSVKIVHPSSSGFHYIKKVVIKKNGEENSSNDYTSQPDKVEWTYTYEIPATAGDVLEATANCSVYGSKTAVMKIE